MTTITQVDFHDGDSLTFWASSVLPEITAASSKVSGLKTLPSTVNGTLCTSNKKTDKRKRKKKNSKKKKTPRVDAEMETFVTMHQESVLDHDASLREQQYHSMVNGEN